MKKYDQNGVLICIIHRKSDWKKGLDFITSDEEFIQLGTWGYNKGKTLDRHYHNEFERTAHRTCECTYVVSGSMKVDLYDLEKEFIESFELVEGDCAAFFTGGHGYEILSDDTRILETKNGPFLGVEKDKTRF